MPTDVLKNSIADEVSLVDTADQSLGSMEKVKAHRHPAQRHRAISVWLVNSQGELLLQQRSEKKITAAGWWGNGVCGNVWPGESYIDCAYRRLEVELGINNPQQIMKLQPCFKFEYRAYINQEFGENELDQVYVARFDAECKPNPDEVVSVRWVNAQKFVTFCAHLPYVAPAETLKFETRDLVTITPEAVFNWKSQKLSITPWTTMMARDQRLHSMLLSET